MREMLLKYSKTWIVALGIVVFGLSIFNGFVWDDEEQIVANEAVHSMSYLGEIWTGSTFNSGGAGALGGMYYKPLMTSFYAFLYTLGGGNPGLFHLFQMVVHIGSTLLLYQVFKKLFKSEFVAFILSIVWMVHPLNVESVVYVAALQDTLAFFFGISALYVLIYKSIVKSSLIVPVLLLLSLFSKETGVLWVAICGVYAVMYKERKSWVRYILGMLATVSVYLYMRVGVAGVGLSKHGLTEISTLPFSSRMMSVPKIIAHYLILTIWPLRILIDEQWVVRVMSLREFYLPLVLVITFILLGIYGLKRARDKKMYIFFTLWFLLGLGLHLQIFPLDMTVADRWFYVPIAGMLGMIGLAFSANQQISKSANRIVSQTVKRRSRREQLYLVLGMMVIGIFSIRSMVRVTNWHDGLRLYGHDIKYNHGSYELENNYGVELYRTGRYEQSRVHFERSIELSPDWWTNYNNLGAYWERVGELEKAEDLYKRAIDNGNYYLAIENYARVLLLQEKKDDARIFLEEMLKYFPNNARLVGMYELSLEE